MAFYLVTAVSDRSRMKELSARFVRPPLAQEREAVLDTYFRDLKVEPVQEGDGWEKIEDLPRLFPEFSKV
jgi:hypothetical protein